MDAANEGEQTGVATQVATKLVERAKTFLGLGNERGIALKVLEGNRIVDMRDRDVMTVERLAQHDIFIAVMAETLVEGIRQHDIAANEEVGGAEVLEGRLLALGG